MSSVQARFCLVIRSHLCLQHLTGAGGRAAEVCVHMVPAADSCQVGRVSKALCFAHTMCLSVGSVHEIQLNVRRSSTYWQTQSSPSLLIMQANPDKSCCRSAALHTHRPAAATAACSLQHHSTNSSRGQHRSSSCTTPAASSCSRPTPQQQHTHSTTPRQQPVPDSHVGIWNQLYCLQLLSPQHTLERAGNPPRNSGVCAVAWPAHSRMQDAAWQLSTGHGCGCCCC